MVDSPNPPPLGFSGLGLGLLFSLSLMGTGFLGRFVDSLEEEEELSFTKIGSTSSSSSSGIYHGGSSISCFQNVPSFILA